MGCRNDDYASDSHERTQLRTEIHFLTDLLCAQLLELEAANVPEFIVPKVQDWWHAHKIADGLRLQAEAELARKVNLRRDALNKLTDEEKKELGLR